MVAQPHRSATRRLFRLVKRHGVDREKWPQLLLWAAKAAAADLLGALDRMGAPRAGEGPPWPADPVIILGHYRSGTTFLQRLFAQDHRFAHLTYFQSLFPESFLLGDKWLKSPLQKLSKRLGMTDRIQRRPFDWNLPAEEDVALAAAFVEQSPAWGQVFGRDATACFARETEPAFVDGYRWLIGRLSHAAHPRRLVLKSPPQLARIPWLLELFPKARFVFICRNPYDVFTSNLGLWKAMERTALHRMTRTEVHENIVRIYDHLHERFLADRTLIPAERFAFTRYEDLSDDPGGEMKRLYRELGLGDIETEPFSRLSAKPGHKGPTGLGEEAAAFVSKRWGRWFTQWGYRPERPSR